MRKRTEKEDEIRRSISFPVSVMERLDRRCSYTRRSGNREVIALVEFALDRLEEADLSELQRLRTGQRAG